MIRSFINKLFNLNKVSETKEGTVKFFNAKKGFGFIILKDSKEEIFVHTTNLVDKIREKNKVTFNIEKGKKGLIATNVRVIKK
ncbi:cold-shock protein [Winogradskyella sediminis]|uniref:Cold-shock DNA-binding protein family n=1 Tax=Winogradskyella sediminis TaxID=1382466 RepID=A0A1H1XFW1_9FLAO|nr:cold shock domain-containing protein [Winogradskyella sediminis]REG86225.1 putative cold-shock DNA-binding protein [Winogradskyella sediminis]SDT08118.1 cold-shock DNA-binding protein family [Winogradskyella sediminis]